MSLRSMPLAVAVALLLLGCRAADDAGGAPHGGRDLQDAGRSARDAGPPRSDGGGGDAAHAGEDAGRVPSDVGDAARGGADGDPTDAAHPADGAVDLGGPSDGEVDAAPGDLGPPCTPPQEPVGPVGAAVELQVPGDQGVGAWERDAYERAALALLEQPCVDFVASWLVDEGAYELRTTRGTVRWRRSLQAEGLTHDVHQGDLASVFPCTSPDLLGTYAEELGAGTNPAGTAYPERGYAAGDARLRFIEPEAHCYPWALERLASLFDSPHAPDLLYGLTPYGQGGVGSHGAISGVQSRSALLMSGAGVARERAVEHAVRLVDVAPTALALLGVAPAEGLVGPLGGRSPDALLRFQDGRALHEALEPACGGAQHVLIVLLDGLNSNELNEVLAHPDLADVPHLRSLASEGTRFTRGAISGFPSLSAPGHLTVGTGVWPGHHGVLSNGVYDRGSGERFSVGELMSRLTDYLDDPGEVERIFRRFSDPRSETIFQALHRAWGPYDAATGSGPFTAAVNEGAFLGADYSVVDLLEELGGSGKPGEALRELDLMDRAATIQVQRLLTSGQWPPPALLYVALYSTDDAGQQGGPHGELLRTTLEEVDEQLGLMLGAYEAAGVLEQTAVIVVADHGMELQDAARTCPHRGALRAAGVRHVDPDGFGFVYLRCLQGSVRRLATGELELIITDDGTGLPVAGALVVGLDAQCEGCDAASDEEGRIVLRLPPAWPPGGSLRVEHPEYNPATVPLPPP